MNASAAGGAVFDSWRAGVGHLILAAFGNFVLQLEPGFQVSHREVVLQYFYFSQVGGFLLCQLAFEVGHSFLQPLYFVLWVCVSHKVAPATAITGRGYAAVVTQPSPKTVNKASLSYWPGFVVVLPPQNYSSYIQTN
jgi:hypothetical protein